jgi:putative ABC transport system substrate-binding protein
MRRREFNALFGGVAATWPLVARAQQAEKMRRVGVTMTLASDDPEAQARVTAFQEKLKDLGWAVDRNIQIDYRWGAGDPSLNRKNAAELVTLGPDVILATGSPTLEPLLQVTRTVPIVFVQITDPVGAGLVESLARPGGNATGFTTMEYGSSGKWLELLKEIAPNVKRVAVLRDATAVGVGQFGAIQAVAPSFGVELRPVGVSDVAEIERTIAAFASDPNGSMIVTESGPSIVHRGQIIRLAARYHLPAVYPQTLFVTGGGLMSYTNPQID